KRRRGTAWRDGVRSVVQGREAEISVGLCRCAGSAGSAQCHRGARPDRGRADRSRETVGCGRWYGSEIDVGLIGTVDGDRLTRRSEGVARIARGNDVVSICQAGEGERTGTIGSRACGSRTAEGDSCATSAGGGSNGSRNREGASATA